MNTSKAELEKTASLAVGQRSEMLRIAADLSIMKDENLRSIVTGHITSIYDVPTPREKVMKRPDGFDYVESTWMDKSWKEFAPLYEYQLVHISESMGWIDIIVSLKDRVTGNVELGGGSARIQVRSGSGDVPGFRDVIDKGNNLKSALTNAIKNAQSRFGISADIYGKREGVRTEEEIKRFKSMLEQIKLISVQRAQMFSGGWEELGVDFTEYLDRWQMYIDRNTPSAEATNKSADNRKSVVTEAKESNTNQGVSDAAGSTEIKLKI